MSLSALPPELKLNILRQTVTVLGGPSVPEHIPPNHPTKLLLRKRTLESLARTNQTFKSLYDVEKRRLEHDLLRYTLGRDYRAVIAIAWLIKWSVEEAEVTDFDSHMAYCLREEVAATEIGIFMDFSDAELIDFLECEDKIRDTASEIFRISPGYWDEEDPYDGRDSKTFYYWSFICLHTGILKEEYYATHDVKPPTLNSPLVKAAFQILDLKAIPSRKLHHTRYLSSAWDPYADTIIFKVLDHYRDSPETRPFSRAMEERWDYLEEYSSALTGTFGDDLPAGLCLYWVYFGLQKGSKEERFVEEVAEFHAREFIEQAEDWVRAEGVESFGEFQFFTSP